MQRPPTHVASLVHAVPSAVAMNGWVQRPVPTLHTFGVPPMPPDDVQSPFVVHAGTQAMALVASAGSE